jgi:hypothetical protein
MGNFGKMTEPATRVSMPNGKKRKKIRQLELVPELIEAQSKLEGDCIIKCYAQYIYDIW